METALTWFQLTLSPELSPIELELRVIDDNYQVIRIYVTVFTGVEGINQINRTTPQIWGRFVLAEFANNNVVARKTN